MVGGAMSTGGLTALVATVFHKKSKNSTLQQRSGEYANSNKRENSGESGVEGGVASSAKTIADEGKGVHPSAG
jgi:hypothetical protein